MAGGPVATSAAIGSDVPQSKVAGILMTCFAAFGGILFGYDTGTIGGILAMQDWACTFGGVITTDPFKCGVTTTQQSVIVSVLSIGTVIGALLGAPIGDMTGRRMGIIISCLIFSIGVAFQTASTAIPLFIIGRIVAGMGVGLVSNLVPMYQSECAPKWIRGAVVSLYQWAITIGLLLASIINNATKNNPNHSSYRIPVAIQFIWAFLLCLGMFFLPESPRYLIKRHREEDAAISMGRLLSLPPNSATVVAELDIIKETLREEEALGQSTYLDCFSSENNNRLRTLTAVFLQAWQQLTGVNFIFYYGTIFFQQAGLNNAFLDSVATNVVNVGMTIPGIYFIDRVGRRNLLLIGAFGMLVCEFIVGIVGVAISTGNTAGQKVLIAFVCIYIAFFAATWGPIAWVVTGEIFPLNIRAKGMSLAVASNWIFNWALAFATPYLVNPGHGNANLGVKVFFIWGSTCVGCFVFTYFFIAETKGLSLEQIDELYKTSTPRTSVRVRNEMIAREKAGVHKDADSHSVSEKA